MLANGLNVGLRRSLGIERQIISACHSISIGFDLVPVGRPAFDFPALTYFSERPSDRIPYLTLFPVGNRMRANLFAYREIDDPWLREMRHQPVETMNAALPRLRRITGEFGVAGDVKIRPADLYVSTGYRQAGIVLVGDAFATTCPVTGTGTDKVFTDVAQLCNVHIPPGLPAKAWARPRSRRSTTIRSRQACDAWSMAKAFSFRTVTIETGLYWRAQRWARFLAWFGEGTVRRMRGRISAQSGRRAHSSSSSSSIVIVFVVVVGLNGRTDAACGPGRPIACGRRRCAASNLRVRAALDRLAARDHDDLVHLDHRGQAVGRPDHGAPLRDLQQRAVDRGFRGLVERRGRFIQQQHAKDCG